MVKEFKDELQAKAIADSLGLFMTKYKGVYIVSNNKEEILARYNLGYYSGDNIFYDKEVFEVDEEGFMVIRDSTLVDASSIKLPYRIRDCSYMFYERIRLEIPPIIPKGVERCDSMFKGCAALKKTPIIPEEVKDCSHMFGGCTSLKTPPILPDGVRECIETFRNCTSLETPPIIPESVKDCYSMFWGCSSLEIPPKIPDGAQSCHLMFQGCISLKSLPNFPENCYTIGALWDTPFAESRGGN